MTLEAENNRYVHYLPAIRAIQDHLERGAASLRIPAVNNTNVDRSVAIIHSTVLACLRRQAQVTAHACACAGRPQACTEEALTCQDKGCARGI